MTRSRYDTKKNAILRLCDIATSRSKNIFSDFGLHAKNSW